MGLIEVIQAAINAGLDQRQRHEACIRYRDAQDEYLRVTPRGEFDVDKLKEHATSKALGYIERHKPRDPLYNAKRLGVTP